MDGMLHKSMRTGASFGLTSGVITTLGLMIGLNAGTHSVPVVVGGILTIAIADALSDALGIHIAEESKNSHSPREIWLATVMTFIAKFLMALTFVVPVLLFELGTAVLVSLAWGLGVISALSYAIARAQGVAPWRVIGEHLAIALVVVALTWAVGRWVARVFA
jgi:VIT1/CCC1 family predicted Fe2+/Mn2+ transporter